MRINLASVRRFLRRCFIEVTLVACGLSMSVVLSTNTAIAADTHSGWDAQRIAWNKSQEPFQIYGNTYYVGVHGLSSILITSAEGHVLIDGALAESAPKIAANIRELGFKVEDIKLILNTHAHFDHAGGIAQLQHLSGAMVAASPPSALILQSGEAGADDPQHGVLPQITPVSQVKIIRDGELLHVGPLVLTANFTPGHTRGGTTWTWKSCENSTCLDIVYADSLNAISSPGYFFTDTQDHPNALKNFEMSFAVISQLPCDILLTPHPELSDLIGKFERREKGDEVNPFVDKSACKNYVAAQKEKLNKRIADEKATAR